MQQFLNFLPLPQGQGSLRPILPGFVEPAARRGEDLAAKMWSTFATSFFSLLVSA